jgi:hypothetical protein
MFENRPLILIKEFTHLCLCEPDGFIFHFTAISFISPEQIRFKYQLPGFDKNWRFLPPGKERTAHYQNLGAGTYTFKVIACNLDGVLFLI